jgi:hypothetical protein
MKSGAQGAISVFILFEATERVGSLR